MVGKTGYYEGYGNAPADGLAQAFGELGIGHARVLHASGHNECAHEHGTVGAAVYAVAHFQLGQQVGSRVLP